MINDLKLVSFFLYLTFFPAKKKSLPQQKFPFLLRVLLTTYNSAGGDFELVYSSKILTAESISPH